MVLTDARGKKRFLRSHSGGAGTADIFAAVPRMHNGGFWALHIEVKSHTGEQSPEQKSFQQHVESLEHEYLLARSADDVYRWLKDHGAIR